MMPHTSRVYQTIFGLHTSNRTRNVGRARRTLTIAHNPRECQNKLKAREITHCSNVCSLGYYFWRNRNSIWLRNRNGFSGFPEFRDILDVLERKTDQTSAVFVFYIGFPSFYLVGKLWNCFLTTSTTGVPRGGSAGLDLFSPSGAVVACVVQTFIYAN